MASRFGLLAASTLGVIAAGTVGYFFLLPESDIFAQCRTADASLEEPLGGPFELLNQAGETVTDKDVFAEPALVYFGYTFCPDICPLDMGRNADAVDLLATRGHSVTPVFVTIDPERDTPEVLADYGSYLHEKMVGLTGTLQQIEALAWTYRVFFQKEDSGDEFYLVSHMSNSFLVLPEAGVVASFARTLDADIIASRTSCFIEAG